MRYPWIKAPWLVPSRFTSWVWPFGIVVSKQSRDDVTLRHRKHEEQHVKQHRTWLVLAVPVWLVLAARVRFDYRSHPWEVQAREAGARGQRVYMEEWKQIVGIVATWLVLMGVVNLLGWA